MSEPYLPLYVGDYLRDTGYLTLEQHGAYVMLLMRLWSAGGTLPADEAKLARIAGVTVKKWRPIWADLADFFEVEDGQLSHKRITAELEKAGALRAKRAAAGAKGGAAKSLKTQEPDVANATARLKQIIPDHNKGKEEPSGSSKKRGSRLPSDWVLPDEFRAVAVEMGLSPERIDAEAARMRDWSLSSKAGVKLDWLATWRNWLRSALERQPMPRGSPASQSARQPKGSELFYQFAEMIDGQAGNSAGQQGGRGDATGIPILTIEHQP